MTPANPAELPGLPLLLDDFFTEAPLKIVFSRPQGVQKNFEKIVLLKQGEYYQVEQFTKTQAFHQTIDLNQGRPFLLQHFPAAFGQVNLWNAQEEVQIKISKKGKLLAHRQRIKKPIRESQGHNRQKNYLLPAGSPIAPLVDMGIFTPEGKVIDAMQHKYRQINRFLEMVEDCLPFLPKDRPLSIIDFGCGKSYLTFVLYYYFTYVKQLSVNITGLDLKKEVIEKCNRTAQKYGYDRLTFLHEDIKDHTSAAQVDMVISLHACDTATDYALMYAVSHQAKAILAVPCCQHELNGQMQGGNLPLLTRYGLVKERNAALMTDAIRANLLTACGYKSQVLEFIDMEHTPKNILLRGLKASVSPKAKTAALKEVKDLCAAFHFNPSFLRLLEDSKLLPH